VAGAQQREGFVVFFLDRRQQLISQRLHFLADFDGLLHQELKADQRQG